MKNTEPQTWFFQDDKMFKKYFRRKKTPKEREEGQKLINMIKGFYHKVFEKELESLTELGAYNQIGYTENYGYYAMSVQNRGYYDVIRGDTIDEVFWPIIREVLLFYGNNYVQNCRKELREDFIKRFGTNSKLSIFQYNNFFDLLYIKEYALIVLNKYYDRKIPDYMVKCYESELSMNSYYDWKFNCKTNKMEIVQSRV